MKTIQRTMLALVAMLGLAVGTANAGPLIVDAGWYGFCFGLAGSPATAGCLNDGIGTEGNTFTFSGPVELRVTDAFLYGDIFDLVIDGAPAVSTSIVPTVAGGVTTDPDIAFADPGYSKYFTFLGAGPHTLDIFADISPYGGGGAYVRVDTPQCPRGGCTVPEPATLTLLGIGSGLLVAFRGRKHNRT